jgi:hypothetical protein
MEHKGVQYSVVQTPPPDGFRWTADFEAGRRGGNARNRTLAILRAIKAIDTDAALRRAESRKSTTCSP